MFSRNFKCFFFQSCLLRISISFSKIKFRNTLKHVLLIKSKLKILLKKRVKDFFLFFFLNSNVTFKVNKIKICLQTFFSYSQHKNCIYNLFWHIYRIISVIHVFQQYRSQFFFKFKSSISEYM